MVGLHNKKQRHLEAIAHACRYLLSKNEYFDIVDDKPESGDNVLENNMESFRSSIQSKLENSPLYYSED